MHTWRLSKSASRRSRSALSCLSCLLSRSRSALSGSEAMPLPRRVKALESGEALSSEALQVNQKRMCLSHITFACASMPGCLLSHKGSSLSRVTFTCAALPGLLMSHKGPHTAECRKKKKRKDYAIRRQFNEKPSNIPSCPSLQTVHYRVERKSVRIRKA